MNDPATQSEYDPISVEGLEDIFIDDATVEQSSHNSQTALLLPLSEPNNKSLKVRQGLQNNLDNANQRLLAVNFAKELVVPPKTNLLLFSISSLLSAVVLTLMLAQSGDFIRIQLPGLFSNHMILQRDQSAIIWGKANPLCPVTLTLISCAQPKFTVATKCDINGAWKVILPPIPAGGPYRLFIKAIDSIQLNEISFGDVFLMLGQSNLIMPISCTDDTAVKSLTHQTSKVWWFKMKPRIADKQDWQTPGVWAPVKNETIENMPAVPYYFAEHLNQKSGVPIGLVISGFGGTPINTWLMPTPWQSRKGHYGGWQDSSIFNTMLAPLIGLKVKATIWYQGEANICNAVGYARTLTNFIKALRESWKVPMLPVFIVQLPAFGSRTAFSDESAWAEIREEQAKAASAANASLIMTVDTAQLEEPSIHPKHKLKLGQRIADTVFTQLYSKSQNTFPSYESWKTDGSSIVLSFKSDSELVSSTSNRDIQGFTIAGPDKRFIIAQAKLDLNGKQVIVRNQNIDHPCAVRYAWTDNPITPLHDRNGLPIVPFRTDTWTLPHHLKLGVAVCNEPIYSAGKGEGG